MTGERLARAFDHHRAGRLDEAARGYRRVLESDPADATALHLLALAGRHGGVPDAFATALKRVLRLDPVLVRARIDLADALEDAGRSGEATAQRRRLPSLAPDHPAAWSALASGLDAAASVAALERAARLAPGSAEAHHALGLALRRAGRLGEAQDSLRRAIRAEPDFLPAHMNLGNGLLDEGAHAQARARLERALALGPATPECWYNLGNASQGHDPEGALRAYGRAARLGLGLARTRVADMLDARGRPGEAEELLFDSLSQPGTDAVSAIEHLSGLLIRRGALAPARELFTRLMDRPLAGHTHRTECLTALAALDLQENAPEAAAARLARIEGDQGWFFTIRSLARLRATLAGQGLRLRRPAPDSRPLPRITSSSLASRGRFAHNVLEYILLRLYAETHGLVLETPDWVGGAFFTLDDPPQSRPLPPLPFARNLLNGLVAGGTAPAAPVLDRDILSPLFLFDHKESQRERVQSWLRPRPVWAPWLDPAVERLRAGGATVVALHLRRGDFVPLGYPITDTAWYVEWLRALWPRLDRPVLYLASDDLPAVRRDFAEFRPLAREDVAPDWPNLEYLQDFHVLTQADVVGISAASGFSQLAARLNRRARIFVEPDMAARCIRPYRPWTP
ncbi:tetratricopeptide repeat protein [Azospirillum agricola]|uniref:tetratricopeptide repeat protein n=1 Tax=Azospirillum agricola TaxID=1720247 RepID=UPI000A0F32EE|nr:tetratricopeptide repeat protein [Azospirillum agricola]SMH61879.1 Tfp pilus assembly protein PilF [Azospirillum lipoferum]